MVSLSLHVLLIFSDIWALGCVLYELATLKHAVSIILIIYTISFSIVFSLVV